MNPYVTVSATTVNTWVGGALTSAIRGVDAKLPAFAHLFPDDTTVANTYHPRPATAEYPEGANTGWTTGFWTGQLWLAYELTGRDTYRLAADAQVESFAQRVERGIDVDHHDLGFLHSLSCVAAYQLTDSDRARDAALLAAERLMTRYFPQAGIIQAWGDLSDPAEQGRIIIDCLMNVPLLHWASSQTGNVRFSDAARRHAEQARRYLVRPDFSTYHTFYFDPENGTPLYGNTHQGRANDSCWSRGEAWGIYGFALAYAQTGERAFQDVAVQLAEYYLRYLPADLVPYWDLDFRDGDGEEKDSSAAAIAACGLLELVAGLPHGVARDRYERYAIETLLALSEGYAATSNSNALLLHGVYGKPQGNGIDEANLWGDYFYLEGLTRLSREWRRYW